ncbi:efflux RND transporter periplasmic adaptor subunit [Lysobacter brunescens]|uniref:Efflux RND transporter periplasmic adaptor subunit n=1 Tax=Lysobacter brunescens TaxID=262323 RepID=A0ABW2YEY4_9GAMM
MQPNQAAPPPDAAAPGHQDPVRHGRFSSKTRLILGAALLAIIAIAVIAFQRLRPPQVIVETIAPSTVEIALAVVGRARPGALVDIKSPNAGQIIRVFRDDGDTVAADEPLAIVRSTVEQAQNDADNARAAAARAEAARAKLAYERTRALAADRFVSRAALDEARASMLSADAAVAAAVAQGRATAARTGEFTIRAPMAGTVLVRPIDSGQVVSTETLLFQIGSVQGVEIHADVDETYADALRPGMAARASLSGTATQFAARVIEVSPRVDASTGGRLVKLVPDRATGIPSGRSIDITIVVATRTQAITIPRQAIRDATTDPTVLVVDANDIARARRVKLLAWPSSNAIIERGLAAGDRVILSPDTIEASSRVRPVAHATNHAPSSGE